MLKKSLFPVIILMLITVTVSHAQFKMSAGDTELGLRAGTVFLHTKKFSKKEKFNASTPAIGFTFETGAWNFGLSVGGEFNYATYKTKDKKGDMSILMGMLYMKYYPSFLTFSKFAPYARVDLLPIGVYKINTPTTIDAGASSVMGFYAGANYQFAEQFGVFAEVGSGYTLVNTGIMWRVRDN